MSYYKVRSINFKRTTGQIFVTCADSGSCPLYYERFEYNPMDSNFAGKCKEFWMEVLAGNYQFLKSNRWYDIERKAYEKMQQIADYTDIGERDFLCKTSFRSQLQEYVAETYLVPLATKEPVTPDAAFEADFIGNCRKEWGRIEKEWEKNKQIPIKCALFSSVFPGWDSLHHDSKNQTIVAKRNTTTTVDFWTMRMRQPFSFQKEAGMTGERSHTQRRKTSRKFWQSIRSLPARLESRRLISLRNAPPWTAMKKFSGSLKVSSFTPRKAPTIRQHGLKSSGMGRCIDMRELTSYDQLLD